MKARLIQEQLEKCQKAEGVNNYEACRWLSDLYLKALAENKGAFRLSTSLLVGLIEVSTAGVWI
jgi:hypothetical protein